MKNKKRDALSILFFSVIGALLGLFNVSFTIMVAALIISFTIYDVYGWD